MRRESVPNPGLFASCHASTVARVGKITLVSYFAGPYEGHRKTSIWLSRKIDDEWLDPIEICSGKLVLGMKRACWNPVFLPVDDSLYLYFKVGKSPEDWRGYSIMSRDRGETWTTPRALAAGILGPTKNPPIKSGDYFVSGSSDERHGFSIHFELSLNGRDWRKVYPKNTQQIDGCIQPSIINLGSGHLIALARSSVGRLVQTASNDDGETWSDLQVTELPNPDSAVATLSLDDHSHLLCYNRSTRSRSPLVLAVSEDGNRWSDRLVLEDKLGEYSYPSICSIPGGAAISYTADRSAISYVEFTTNDLGK